jgi:hypothetical protein
MHVIYRIDRKILCGWNAQSNVAWRIFSALHATVMLNGTEEVITFKTPGYNSRIYRQTRKVKAIVDET